MGTPTVIRHAQRGNAILQVITYFERGQLNAVFQEYVVSENGHTSLNVSKPYLHENGAVSEWMHRMISVRA